MGVNVYLVRHGQTYFNLYRRVQGWSDTPLTEKGRADSARAGKALAEIRFDRVLASDLGRTLETARILLANHPGTIKEPTPDAAFREEFFGYFEGLNNDMSALTVSQEYHSFEDLVAHYGVEATRQRIAQADPFHQAETTEAFWERLTPGLDRLRDLPDESNVLVVSHGMTIRSIGNRFGNHTTDAAQPQNGAIAKLILTADTTRVDFYNQLQLPK